MIIADFTNINIYSPRKNMSKRQTTIKCAQLNLQHSRTATCNMTQLILQNNIDVAFVQEPYTVPNNVAEFPKSFRIFAHGGGRKRSAIFINNNNNNNNNINPLEIRQL